MIAYLHAGHAIADFFNYAGSFMPSYNWQLTAPFAPYLMDIAMANGRCFQLYLYLMGLGRVEYHFFNN
jgi:hypothetical protein